MTPARDWLLGRLAELIERRRDLDADPSTYIANHTDSACSPRGRMRDDWCDDEAAALDSEINELCAAVGETT